MRKFHLYLIIGVVVFALGFLMKSILANTDFNSGSVAGLFYLVGLVLVFIMAPLELKKEKKAKQ
ncbi:hypothetical protein ACFLTH_05700 [Bacteroidota bacterium]